MIVEGVGSKAPQQIQVKLSRHEMLTVLDVAKQRAEFRQYKARADLWGQGIKDGIEVDGLGIIERDVRPIFCGTLGEYAIQRWLTSRLAGCVELDTELRQHGDYGVDLKAYGLSMQVKTRQNNERVSLIRHTTENGRRIPCPWYAACFCEWTGGSVIYLVGWQWRSFIEKIVPTYGRAGGWMNVEVLDEQTLPMQRLASELETWRYAHQCRS